MIRSPEGKWQKENPAVTERIEANLTTLKVARRRADILSTMKDHPGWLCVKEILSERVKALERKRKSFYSGRTKSSTESLDQRGMDLLLQQQTDYEDIANIVDDFLESASGFDEAIARNEKELSERKQNVPV